MKKYRNMKKGSMTLEACVILPLFLCLIISVIFLIKLTYTHELVQHAINEAAWEIASSAYIYQASGLGEIKDTTREGIKNSTKGLKDNIAGMMSNLDILGNGSLNTDDSIEALTGMLVEGAFESTRSELFAPVVQKYVEKYVAAGYTNGADSRLKLLNIRNGIHGLDFSQSSFLKNEEENVEIVVTYEIELPLPINILPELEVVQRASAKAWMTGDEPAAGNSRIDDIWSLGNLERGAKIRAAFGANLPYSFPVISSFENGRATMIKSMDLTAASYQYTNNVRETLESYIKELVKFKGQETPWGSSKIIINSRDIDIRQLLLVIPQNGLLPEVEKVLEACVDTARSRGVELEIVRYGMKQAEAPANKYETEASIGNTYNKGN